MNIRNKINKSEFFFYSENGSKVIHLIFLPHLEQNLASFGILELH